MASSPVSLGWAAQEINSAGREVAFRRRSVVKGTRTSEGMSDTGRALRGEDKREARMMRDEGAGVCARCPRGCSPSPTERTSPGSPPQPQTGHMPGKVSPDRVWNQISSSSRCPSPGGMQQLRPTQSARWQVTEARTDSGSGLFYGHCALAQKTQRSCAHSYFLPTILRI